MSFRTQVTACIQRIRDEFNALRSNTAEVDSTFLAAASVPIQDVNDNGTLAITSERADTGWTIAGNVLTYAGTPDSVRITVMVKQAIANGVNIQRPAPVLSLRKNGAAAGNEIANSATGYIRDATDHEESSNTIAIVDHNPGTNPTYTVATEQDSTQGGVVNSEIGHFTAEAVEKVTAIILP